MGIFTEVHLKAKAMRRSRHVEHCAVCRTNKNLCVTYAQLSGISREEWLRRQKESNDQVLPSRKDWQH